MKKIRSRKEKVIIKKYEDKPEFKKLSQAIIRF